MSEAAYICPTCGEEIVVPIDPSEGDGHETIEDCPVCCHPNRLTIIREGGEVRLRAEST